MKVCKDIEKWADTYTNNALLEKDYSIVKENHWAVEQFFGLEESDPELCLEAIIRITQKTDSPKFLGVLGAGPLEDIVDSNGEKLHKEPSNQYM